jgi:hypothetical protein
VNLLINSSREERNRPRKKLINFLRTTISFLGSSRRYNHSGGPHTFCLTLQIPRRCECYTDMSCFYLQGQNDMSMEPKLRHVSVGCEDRIESYDGYDINGYRFHTKIHEQNRPNRRTTNTSRDGNGYPKPEYPTGFTR